MNFRARIIRTFLGFVVLLTIVFGFLLDSLMNYVEDVVIQDFLIASAQHIENNVDKFKGISDQLDDYEQYLINKDYIQTYLSSSPNTPDFLKNLKNGFHEVGGYHILIDPIENVVESESKIIILFDESNSFLDRNEKKIILAIFISSSLIIVLTITLCLYLGKKIAFPIEELAKSILDKEGDISNSSALSRNDELGRLAKAFNQTIEKLNDVLEREKEFSRYASHELRTPLTVVRNCVDLIKVTASGRAKNGTSLEPYKPEEKQLLNEKVLFRSINRIDNAVWFMEQQVNTLLLIARGEYRPDSSEIVLTEILDELSHYFPNLKLNIVQNDQSSIVTDRVIFLGILSNIVNSTMEHGVDNKGMAKADLCFYSDGFKLVNATEITATLHEGRRFGSEIVEKLSLLLGWTVEFRLDNIDSQRKTAQYVTRIYYEAPIP